MTTRRRFVTALGTVSGVLAGCSDDGGSADGDGTDGGGAGGTPTPTQATAGSLSFSATAFEDGGTIPERYTGVGEDVSPELIVESVPEGAAALALVVDDPDADDFVHWLIWNVPADTETIPAGVPQGETVESLDGARQGTNDFGELGYRGPLPPSDDGPHTYRFTMSAVDTTLELEAGAGRGELMTALGGAVLDTHQITGEFER